MNTPLLTMDILVAIVALAEWHTYERAGDELGLSPSAVHKRIRAAEQQLGYRIFIGMANGMELTKEGRVFYPEAVRTINQAVLAEEKVRCFAELNRGSLLVGHSTFLPGHLLKFLMRLDLGMLTGLHLEHRAGITTSLVRDVARGSLQAAFSDLSVDHRGVSAIKLFEEPLVACMSRSHPLSSKPTVGFRDLDNVPMIAVGREIAPLDHRQIEEHLLGAGIRLKVVAEAYGQSEALNMVEQNMGICLLGASAARSSMAVVRPLTAHSLRRRFGFYIREDNRHPALHEFIEFVSARITAISELSIGDRRRSFIGT